MNRKNTMAVSMSLILLTCITFAWSLNGGTIMLPVPEHDGETSVEKAIFKRRSVRAFKKDSLDLKQISQLLFAAQGITDQKDRHLRAVPSAGATYPLEFYIMTTDGIYKYLPGLHSLQLHKGGDYRNKLGEAALGQYFIADAPMCIIINAVFERTTSRYHRRGERYVYMEAGHAAQNIALQAVALGLGSVPVGAFDNEAVQKVLSASNHEQALYILPIGKEDTR